MRVDWDEIKIEYIKSKGQIVLKELAKKYKVKDSTLRSRKNREKWDDEIESKGATSHATQRKKNKNVATQKNDINVKESESKDIDKKTLSKEVGAKGKHHEWLTDEGLIKIEGWARDGLIDEQIAENMGISVATLYNYKNKYLEILEALKRGKEVIDRQVENALLRKALGYSYTETKIEQSDMGSKETRTIKEVVPDTTAQIFWLKNRKPDTWRDRPKADDKDVLSKLDKLIEEIGDEAKS